MEATQLLKGVLDVAVLSVLTESDGYGYDVARRLRDGGLSEVAEASVYGTLRRLFKAGLLTTYVVPSDEGPHRKYYGINDAGRAFRDDASDVWREFRDSLDRVIDKAGSAT